MRTYDIGISMARIKHGARFRSTPSVQTIPGASRTRHQQHPTDSGEVPFGLAGEGGSSSTASSSSDDNLTPKSPGSPPAKILRLSPDLSEENLTTTVARAKHPGPTRNASSVGLFKQFDGNAPSPCVINLLARQVQRGVH